MSDGQAWAASQIDSSEPESLAGISHVIPCNPDGASPNWVRTAKLRDLHDGDTLTLEVDCGFDIAHKIKVRLVGVDCPELNTPEGKAAREFSWHFLTEIAGPLTLETVRDKTEKYGRYLGIVRVGGRCLNTELVTAGHAKPYDGGKR